MNTQGLRIKRETQDVEFPCNTEIPPAIPDRDDYEVKFVRAEQSHQWNGDKVFLWFEMLTPGQWAGTKFFMACNAKRDGRWGPSHKFAQAWILANGTRPKRRDRMSTKVFRDKVFRARMRTVTKDANQRDRTSAQQYSVVDELLEQVDEAADVSCKSLIALEDSLPQVGIGAGESASEGESTRESEGICDGIDNEYELKCWREWEEECEEMYGKEFEEECEVEEDEDE